VQLLTHGLGFDRSYWDLDGDEYNYISAATGAGYSTFSYDRLGNGASTIADPYTTVQTVVELAILTELTTLLRAGTISSSIPIPKKVVHVGHSYGSLLSNGMAAKYPDLSDGIVLTGYSLNTTWQLWFEISTSFHLASENQPSRFGNLSSGYLTWGDKYYNQYSFLKYPYFDPKVLDQAEAGKQPFTLGELLTFPLVPFLAPKFAKPVLVSYPVSLINHRRTRLTLSSSWPQILI
jgi:pimeloyl-ACP methyl ester carboxylesterase